ncbi:MAG TPA: hypothetical protein VNZ47_01710 [Candidatus Dormibacteraeota bacterium]|nr:hypothetical protein [Candidatus Dormibacteraeota bacterium]
MKAFGTVLGNIFGALLALALTAALGYYGYIAAKRLAVLFARLDFTVAMVTVTATVTVLLAAMIIGGSIRRASAQGREVQLRPDKAEAYKLFIGLWEEMMRPGQTEESLAHLSRQMQDVNHLLLLHGSPAVLKIHAAMQTQNLPDARTQLAAALLEIRKDLGMDSHGLDSTDLIGLLFKESDRNQSASRQGMHLDTQPRVSLAPN